MALAVISFAASPASAHTDQDTWQCTRGVMLDHFGSLNRAAFKAARHMSAEKTVRINADDWTLGDTGIWGACDQSLTNMETTVSDLATAQDTIASLRSEVIKLKQTRTAQQRQLTRLAADLKGAEGMNILLWLMTIVAGVSLAIAVVIAHQRGTKLADAKKSVADLESRLRTYRGSQEPNAPPFGAEPAGEA